MLYVFACSLGLLGPGSNLRAEPVFEGPVVILAEHKKDEMDASVSGASFINEQLLSEIVKSATTKAGQVESCVVEFGSPQIPLRTTVMREH